MVYFKGDLGQLYSLFIFQLIHTHYSKTADQSSTLHIASCQESPWGAHKSVTFVSLPDVLHPSNLLTYVTECIHWIISHTTAQNQILRIPMFLVLLSCQFQVNEYIYN